MLMFTLRRKAGARAVTATPIGVARARSSREAWGIAFSPPIQVRYERFTA